MGLMAGEGLGVFDVNAGEPGWVRRDAFMDRMLHGPRRKMREREFTTLIARALTLRSG